MLNLLHYRIINGHTASALTFKKINMQKIDTYIYHINRNQWVLKCCVNTKYIF